ncbi:hypothetical protein HBI57_223570 [Parastagonospora nodorum]|nr:hypothetical protein HBI11_205900 [Parastagonospora nodorum]KAH5988356.1 hypothetical protein HBI84_195970 [Parastagonospora nodorum]KAH6446110.1 hypothetical protein HBI57_223570 [Parastagonospora nodorum]KAH6449121.1 hypothetical protein HBI58_216340 [Parastagonospora nodorum]
MTYQPSYTLLIITNPASKQDFHGAKSTHDRLGTKDHFSTERGRRVSLQPPPSYHGQTQDMLETPSPAPKNSHVSHERHSLATQPPTADSDAYTCSPPQVSLCYSRLERWQLV